MHRHERLDPALILDNLDLDTARLDQHLLTSRHAIRTLVDSAQLTRHDIVADLGAGTGQVTRELLSRRPAKTYAVEIDSRFQSFLEPLARENDLEVICGDILTTQLLDVTKVVANPPFRITEQLVEWLRRPRALVSASLVMGRSFGMSATAAPGSRAYTRLSLKVQARFVAHMVTSLSPKEFHPSTRTPACILRLVPKRPPARVDAAVDDAFTSRAGTKLKDLLWHLQSRSPALGPPHRRRRIVANLRRSAVVQDMYQQRLQHITSADLSRFMAELHQQTQRS
jgi:16S rRNA A1518/A1519 N6-dimethyltransferase RsmA/KsgA/DIM1 with predicted DNA glycosylase/AP lyase activity